MSDTTPPSPSPNGQPTTIQAEMVRLRHNYDANLLVLQSLKKISESDWDQIQARYAWQPLSNALLPCTKLAGAARASVLGGFLNTTLSILGTLSAAVIQLSAQNKGKQPPVIEGREAQTRWIPELEKAWNGPLPFKEVWQSLLYLGLLFSGGLPQELDSLAISLCRPVGTPPPSTGDGVPPQMQFGLATLNLPTKQPDNLPPDLIHLAYFSACVLAHEVARWVQENRPAEEKA